MVVNEGLTGAIIGLWAGAMKKRVAFDIQVFHALEEARMWLGIERRHVA